MTDEQRQFLKDLQHELNTQDTVCQADPRFWVVTQDVTMRCTEDDGPDYYMMSVDGEWEDAIRVETKDYDIARDIADSIDKYAVELSPVRVERRIASDTMFLTLRECEEHIKRNHYHYNNPLPYAITAWRSPQVERLIEILQTVDWDDVQ